MPTPRSLIAPALCLALLCLAATSHAQGLFAPKTYDDCVLEGAKTAGTQAQLAVVLSSCARKHPETAPAHMREQEREYTQDGLRVCEVLWSGTRFVRRTEESLPGFRIAQFRYLDAILVKAAIPERKLEDFRTPGGAPDGAKLEAFFTSNADSVKAACGV